jgi:DNA replication protein DnaC
LQQRRLSGVRATLEARPRQAIEGQWAAVEWLARVLDDEGERRAQTRRALRVRRAALKTTTTSEGVEWRVHPTINRQQGLHPASWASIRQKRTVLICGPTGVGNSHLAQALAPAACRQGVDVLFVNTHKMLQHLHGGRADGPWMKRVRGYLRPERLVLDDCGLKPLVAPAPADRYDGIKARYDVGGVLVTSNRAPPEWPDRLGNPLPASAGVDRLAHQAETLVITGRRFRAQGRPPMEPPVGELAQEKTGGEAIPYR